MTELVDSIAALDVEVRRALETGDESGLDVIGYGEISLVVALETSDGPRACKRLPPFSDRTTYSRYAEVFELYLSTLADAGVEVVDSCLVDLPSPGPGDSADCPDGGGQSAPSAVTAYCVQPRLDLETLGPLVAAGAGGESFLRQVVDTAADTITPRLGLDSQVSNWALVEGELVYLDVTTPMMRDANGDERADPDIFVGSLPWILRAPSRRFLLESILTTYYEPRSAMVDMLGNLVKEGLASIIPAGIAAANATCSPPITEGEVRSFYRRDARLWGLLQRVRRIDRGWQRHVRRRTYPYLLPGRIER